MVRVSFRWQKTVYLNHKEINLNIVKTDRLSNNVLEFESRNSKYYWRSLSPKRLSLRWNEDIGCYETLVEIKEGRYHGALEFDDTLHRLLPFRIVGLSYVINLTSASVKQFVQMSESVCHIPEGYRPFGSAPFSCEDKSEDSYGQFRLYSSEKSRLDRLATKDPISHPSVNLIYLLHNTAEKLRNELNDKKDEIRMLKRELSHEKQLTQQLLFEKHEFLDIINNLFQETTLVKVPDEHLVSGAQSSSVEKRSGNHVHAQNRYSLEEVRYKDTQNNKVMSGEETTIDEIHLVLEDDKSGAGNVKDAACDRDDFSEGVGKPHELSSSQESFESASCSKVFDCDGSCSMSVEKETKGIQTVISTMPKKVHLLSSISDYDFTYSTLPASFAKKKLHFVSNGVSKSVTSDYCSRSSSILSKQEVTHASHWVPQSHSLPEFPAFPKLHGRSDSGSSTDSLLNEADQFIQEHISNPMSSTPRAGKAAKERYGKENSRSFEESCRGPCFPFIPKKPSDLKFNYRIKVMLKKFHIATGRVRFVGNVLGDSEPIIGVELDVPEGDSDGLYKGQLLFKTDSGKAAFVRLGKVIMAWPDLDD